jgi:hypothetical protein
MRGREKGCVSRRDAEEAKNAEERFDEKVEDGS